MLPGTVAAVCAALWPTPNPATASITAAAWKGFICMTVCRQVWASARSTPRSTRPLMPVPAQPAGQITRRSTRMSTDGAGSQRLRIGASFQPLPNTDPGLAGETGVSRDEGTVYGVDGLKIGAGSEGALFSQGPPTPRPMWPPRAPPPPPPPRPAASASVAAAAVSMTAARTIIVLRESDLCLML